MKKSLTLLLILMMGLVLCGGQLFAEEPPDQPEPEVPEFYGSNTQQVLEFNAVSLTEVSADEGPEGDEIAE